MMDLCLAASSSFLEGLIQIYYAKMPDLVLIQKAETNVGRKSKGHKYGHFTTNAKHLFVENPYIPFPYRFL